MGQARPMKLRAIQKKVPDSGMELSASFIHSGMMFSLTFRADTNTLYKSNAGGGGERVLWAAIRAIQRQYPHALCVVYTGDHDVSKVRILEGVKRKFNIILDALHIEFLYLTTRHWILPSRYRHFTLLGQSLGSLVVAYDAFSLFVPDVFVDTMGYSFTTAFCSYLFPDVPTGAYVHYPTISTDMLESLAGEQGEGLNAGAGKGWKGFAKKRYWQLFARLYGWTGGCTDVVMTNSSWTQAHISSLWNSSRQRKRKSSAIGVVFPPVAVDELEQGIEVDEASENQRSDVIVYIAQFRPEKNHELILRAFAEFTHPPNEPDKKPGAGARLLLIGNVRDSEDEKRIYALRLLAHDLKIKEEVQFACNSPWPDMLKSLGKSSVGVNGMWNEHFGIGVVEYQAAGLIGVVNNSGGPKNDIVVDVDGLPTGYHASTASEYAAAFENALSLSLPDKIAMRQRARKSAKRFTEEAFADRWLEHVANLVKLRDDREKSQSIFDLDSIIVLGFIVFLVAGEAWTLASE